MTEENEIKEYFKENEWNTMSEAEKAMFTKFSVTLDVFSSEEVKVKEEPIDDDENEDDPKVLDATGGAKDEPMDVNKSELLDIGENKILWNENVQDCKDECEEKFVKNEPNGEYIVNFQPLLVIQNGPVIENDIGTNESPKETVNKMYSCWKCCYKSTSKHSYTLHLYKHNAFRQLVQLGKELYKCNSCEFVTNQLLDMHTHVKIKHREQQQIVQYTYKCNICSKLFKTNFARKSHMLTHSDERNFHCTYCDYKAKMKSHLMSHLMFKHLMGKTAVPHKCSQCDYRGFSNIDLSNHLVTHFNQIANSNEEKKLKCSKCNYETKYKSYLDKHFVVHTNERAHECSVCNRRFKQAAHLKSHEVVHSKPVDIDCIHCNYKTNSMKCLRGHLKYHHPGQAKQT